MKNVAPGRDARLLADAFSLFKYLVGLTVQADKAGELYKEQGHRLLRITGKAQDRYLRIRSEFNCKCKSQEPG